YLDVYVCHELITRSFASGQYWELLDLAFFLKCAGLTFEVVFEFLPEFLHDGNCRHRRCIAQGAKGTAQHVLREIKNIVDIFLQAAARMKSDQRFLEPIGAFAAGNAP